MKKDAPPRSTWDWKTGEPSIFRPLQLHAKNSLTSTARVESDRAAGQDRSAFYGLSRKSDELLNTQRKTRRAMYSPPVEGAEAGQRAADRRDAIRRGGR